MSDGAAGVDTLEDDDGLVCVGSSGVPAGSLDVSTLSATEVCLAVRLPTIVRPIELAKKSTANMPVRRVRRLPAPRADMKPDGPPPIPSAPPSER